ncbi:ExbD/TolR family protein [Alkalilimnicola sp. S0819]|uniref:ExbD/TolR family protein n=1 Tax=Alkalilimnicola sp. S0819 TaxID=2613922 RepID=UPI00126151ED|nr:biopolymer transporter ExbD [Alkalilimnicola sp. S0819]KAB7627630.1 biopolymer transporter ExbD [Alkalilimnicola sp. S0819]MPQ15794.1 biopolymer transporter ExbD [Alkalilimnicola sp. S0819]
MNLRPRRREDPDINLTPLIDVVFLLLIFFMVSTTFLRDANLRINLPQAALTPQEQPEQSLELTINSRGEYFLDGRALVNSGMDTLRRALEEAGSGDTALVLRADADTPHQAVVTALEAAGKAGIASVGIATTQDDDE